MVAPLALVLHGAIAPDAPPDEQDTLVQAACVAGWLSELGFDARTVAVDGRLAVLPALAALQPALAFNLVEALDGRSDGIHAVPERLAGLGIPFTGGDAAALQATTDKRLAKRRLVAAGLPTPAWSSNGRVEGNGPWIVKPAGGEASVGIDPGSVVTGAAAARARLQACAARDGGAWFVERYIDGREFNVALLEVDGAPRRLPVAEIRFVDFPPGVPCILDYAAKWEPGSHAARHTPRRFDHPPGDAALLARLGDLALDCWRLFGLGGYARVDFRVDAAGAPWVLEVNVNPCLAPDAGFMAAAARAGLDGRAVTAHLVSAAQAPVIEAVASG